ncbi:unnamed protein product, partial [Aphanomyces euteiches]
MPIGDVTAATVDASKNSVSASPSSVLVDGAVTLTAAGDRQFEEGVTSGDERFIPTSWSSTEAGKTGAFNSNGGNYTSNYRPADTGSYVVTAVFIKQIWNGEEWENTISQDTKTAAVTVGATAATVNAANNSVSASPSSVKAGETVTLTAAGDRQFEEGVT